MATKLTFDMTTITEQVAQMVNGCIEVARDHLVGSITDIQFKAPVDIDGTREQILDNARYLLPFIAPNALKQKTTVYSRIILEPKLYIVVGGIKPDIRAYVIIGYNAPIPRSKLLYSDASDSTATALEKLLETTVTLVNKYKHDAVCGKRRAVGEHGGYYEEVSKTTPEEDEHEMWWGSSKRVSPLNGGGGGSGSSGSGNGGGGFGLDGAYVMGMKAGRVVEQVDAAFERISPGHRERRERRGEYVGGEGFTAGLGGGLNIHGM